MRVVSILLWLAAICFSIAGIVNWFQHDDHAALGFTYLASSTAGLSMVLATSARRRW